VSRYQDQSGSKEYSEIVAAQSWALESLSREVAETVKNYLK